MRPKDFLRSIDRAKVVSTIRAVEKQTNGQIRVFVSRQRQPDTMKAARRAFAKLKMARTAGRNGVLIFLAPESQALAIVGDVAVHEKCGDDFWHGVVEEMETHLRHGEFTAAIVNGVQKVGAVLGEHFPRQPGDRNELPDEIAED
ncbi:MAG: TPM domain-containing protein [Chthoniobacterales bacterium]